MWPLLTGGDDGAAEKSEANVDSLAPPPKPEWKSAMDKSTGKVYYYHRVTKQRSWTKPERYDEERAAYKCWKKKMMSQDLTEATTHANSEVPPAPYDESDDVANPLEIEENNMPNDEAESLALKTSQSTPDLETASLALSTRTPGKVREEQEVVFAPDTPKASKSKRDKDKSKDTPASPINWDKRPKPEAIIFPTPSSSRRSLSRQRRRSLGTASAPATPERTVDKTPATAAPTDKAAKKDKENDSIMYHSLPENGSRKRRKGGRRRSLRRSLSPEKMPFRTRPLFRQFPSSSENNNNPKPKSRPSVEKIAPEETPPTDTKPREPRPPVEELVITAILPDEKEELTPPVVEKKKKTRKERKKKEEEDKQPPTREIILHHIAEPENQDKYAVDATPAEPKPSDTGKEKKHEGIPKRVQFPFFKSRTRSRSSKWTSKNGDEIETVDDGLSTGTPSTLSKSSSENSIKSHEKAAAAEEESGWNQYENLCTRQLWHLCDMIDPYDNVCVGAKSQTSNA